jgi:hypothetical protein
VQSCYQSFVDPGLYYTLFSLSSRGTLPPRQPQQISYDRTEPIVGAKILSEVYAKYGDKWVVDLLYQVGDLWLRVSEGG